jgi:cell volume regulation protein A
MFPLLAGLPGAEVFFTVAFVVVLASLVLQGWTVAPAMRWLGLELPSDPEVSDRLDFDLLGTTDRELAVYRVAANAAALDRPARQLAMPHRAQLIAVMREGVVVPRNRLDRFQPRDTVLALAPPEELHALDLLFAARPAPSRDARPALGDFALDPTVPVQEIVDLYGLPAPVKDRPKLIGDLLVERLHRAPAVGDRVHFGLVDLIVAEMEGDRVTRIGISLDPEPVPFERLNLPYRLRRALAAPLRPIQRLWRGIAGRIDSWL